MGLVRLADIDVRGKRVFIRSDLNVPQDDAGAITDDSRIRASVPGIRDVLVDMLTELGYQSQCAHDGAEAVALYQQAREAEQPFTAVLLDLTIPGGMGGKETIAHLQAMDPQVCAIVSSGYANDPLMADFRAYGFSGVISKPYTLEGLQEVLQRVIEARSD